MLVVEHDEPTIREADHVIEIGPSALAGSAARSSTRASVPGLLKADTLTGKYLRGDHVRYSA